MLSHFWPHRTHEMTAIVADVLAAWCVCQPVCHAPELCKKRVKGPTSYLKWRLLGSQETKYQGVPITLQPGEANGNFC